MFFLNWSPINFCVFCLFVEYYITVFAKADIFLGCIRVIAPK